MASIYTRVCMPKRLKSDERTHAHRSQASPQLDLQQIKTSTPQTALQPSGEAIIDSNNTFRQTYIDFFSNTKSIWSGACLCVCVRLCACDCAAPRARGAQVRRVNACPCKRAKWISLQVHWYLVIPQLKRLPSLLRPLQMMWAWARSLFYEE